MQVMKRNGALVEFDRIRIENAINAAFLEVDGKLYETDTAYDIASDIEKKIKKSHVDVSVETIQDWIEDYLMRSERRDVARAYIRYRYKKEVARNHKDDFMNAIGEKLAAKNV
jgi:anaerobic ribonucleoside-triphosphate reductase